jgi:hypothetical protein
MRTARVRVRVLACLAILSAAVLGAASCQGGGGVLPALFAALVSAALLAACDRARSLPDAGSWSSGSWVECCETGQLSSCFCSTSSTCNFGPVRWCADGTCRSPLSPFPCPEAGSPAAVDAGAAEVGAAADASDGAVQDAAPDLAGDVVGDAGVWSACCVDGRISSCLCSATASCNYLLLAVFCPDGTCVMPRFVPDSGGQLASCPAPDAGGADAQADGATAP